MILTMVMVQQAMDDARDAARKGLTQNEDLDPWLPLIVVGVLLLASVGIVIGSLYLLDWLMPNE